MLLFHHATELRCCHASTSVPWQLVAHSATQWSLPPKGDAGCKSAGRADTGQYWTHATLVLWFACWGHPGGCWLWPLWLCRITICTAFPPLGSPVTKCSLKCLFPKVICGSFLGSFACQILFVSIRPFCLLDMLENAHFSTSFLFFFCCCIYSRWKPDVILIRELLFLKGNIHQCSSRRSFAVNYLNSSFFHLNRKSKKMYLKAVVLWLQNKSHLP